MVKKSSFSPIHHTTHGDSSKLLFTQTMAQRSYCLIWPKKRSTLVTTGKPCAKILPQKHSADKWLMPSRVFSIEDLHHEAPYLLRVIRVINPFFQVRRAICIKNHTQNLRHKWRYFRRLWHCFLHWRFNRNMSKWKKAAKQWELSRRTSQVVEKRLSTQIQRI